MTLTKIVTVKKLFHRNNHCLGIFFDKDWDLIREVKKIPEIKFSDTHKCWYIPDHQEALSKIIESLKGKVWADYSSLKSKNEIVATVDKSEKKIIQTQSVLSQNLIPMLQEYLTEYKPGFWLFEGVAGERYSASLQKILKQATKKAGVKKAVRLHMLRHSYATHLLESGTSTRYIQVLLGHESPKTTEIYAHVSRFALDKIQSPLDQIAFKKQIKEGEDE
ncbi:MAG: tyrosine-type recombinase/integrase [Cyclobacteriaceae bacterium]